VTVSKVIWCDRGWMPHYYGFCPDEAAWKRELKRLGVPNEPYPTSAGRCTTLENAKDKNHCSIVTISDEKQPALQKVGLIVHEAMHIWRAIRESIGEHSPSQEFEAYSIQMITQNLIAAYEKTRGRLCRA
jgi:hypothetical protein